MLLLVVIAPQVKYASLAYVVAEIGADTQAPYEPPTTETLPVKEAPDKLALPFIAVVKDVGPKP